MRRGVQLLLTALVLACGLQAGVAASLTTTAARVGAGTAAVSACDGALVFRNVIDTSGRITTVTTAGIHASCAGGTLRITLVNGSSSVGSGSALLPSSGFTGTADVAISPQPLSSGVTAVHAVVEGP